jgi:CRP-like cAMP-binding protein
MPERLAMAAFIRPVWMRSSPVRALTAKLPDAVLDCLAACAVVKRFSAGSILFQENMQNDQLMIIWTGRVALDMLVPERDSVRILTLGTGEVVGWSALLGGGRMTTSAQAIDDTQVVSFHAPTLQTVCESDHSFGYFLMSKVAGSVASRLLDTRLELLDLLTFEQAVGIGRPQPPRTARNRVVHP